MSDLSTSERRLIVALDRLDYTVEQAGRDLTRLRARPATRVAPMAAAPPAPSLQAENRQLSDDVVALHDRQAATLEAMAEAFGGERRAAVCRELTKTYEEVRRGGLAELAEWAVEGARGEITVVVEGGAAKEVSLEDGVATVLDLASGGVHLKDACAQVAEATGLSKKALYDASIAAR